ncbi:MAG TPA: hypothetical protein VMW24_03290 [Sedimentisphaerales bacterium]|nr:hypothetical protein [Sedimentisphaerales bacterium]
MRTSNGWSVQVKFRYGEGCLTDIFNCRCPMYMFPVKFCHQLLHGSLEAVGHAPTGV